MDKLYEEIARLIFDLKTFKSISGVFYVLRMPKPR